MQYNNSTMNNSPSISKINSSTVGELADATSLRLPKINSEFEEYLM